MKGLHEKPLYNKSGEVEAVSTRLEDIKNWILSKDSSLEIDIIKEDYDEYGCEHCLVIKGKYALLKLEKNHGGMFCPADYLDVKITPRRGYWFSEDEFQEFILGEDYEKQLTKLLPLFLSYINNGNIYSENISFDYPLNEFCDNPAHASSDQPSCVVLVNSDKDLSIINDVFDDEFNTNREKYPYSAFKAEKPKLVRDVDFKSKKLALICGCVSENARDRILDEVSGAEWISMGIAQLMINHK